jgi:hypothetical protein
MTSEDGTTFCTEQAFGSSNPASRLTTRGLDRGVSCPGLPGQRQHPLSHLL